MGTNHHDRNLRDRTGLWVLERWQLRKELHRGASGELWLARERESRELVVARIASSPAEVARAQREGRALSLAPPHPGVPRLVAQGALPEGGWVTLVEHVDGAQLTKVLRVARPSAARSIAWARRIADAVAHLHAAGIAHGDLTVDNVLLARDEVGRDRLVLVGFGCASLPGDPGPSLGSPTSAAPERLADASPTAAADVWALGALLYRMLLDRWPYAGPAEAERGPPARFGDVDPELRVPPGLEPLVRRCLLRAPAERFGSAELLCAELAAIEFAPHRDWVRVDGAMAAPPRGPASRKAPRRLGAHPGVLAVALVLVLIILWWWWR